MDCTDEPFICLCSYACSALLYINKETTNWQGALESSSEWVEMCGKRRKWYQIAVRLAHA